MSSNVKNHFSTKITPSFFQITFCLVVFTTLPFLSNAQDGYEVKKVRFNGNKTFQKEELMANLSVYEVSFMQRITRKKEPFFYSKELADIDLERIIRFYQREGFIYVQGGVDTINVDKEKRRLDLIFTIRENEPILVDSLAFSFQQTDSTRRDSLTQRVTRRVLNKSVLKKNERFRDLILTEDIVRINKAFQNRGFAYSKTSYELDINTAENKTDIFFHTSPGPRAKFGETNITGYEHSREKFIRHQLTYSAGERYDASKLDLLRRNLYDLQLYRIISVAPKLDIQNPKNPIPVEITLEEFPRISTKFGVGYGTEDKFRAFVDFTYRGVFSDATRLNLYLKHSALEPYHASLKLIQPQFLDKKTSIMINPYLRRQVEPGYDTQTLGLSIPLNRKYSDQFNMALTYYYEKVAQQVESDDYDVPDPESSQYLYDKSGLQYSVIYNNALPRFSPEKGFSAALSFKYNGYLFPSDFNYTRLWIDLRNYQKLGGFTLALRGMIGGIHTTDSAGFIPVEDRFYSGGSNSIRGWTRSELGPKRESGTPLGGKSVLEMSVELRHRLFGQLNGAVFMDVGNVWEDAYRYRFNDLAYSAGIGLRYQTPIGPIRLDMSMPLWNEKKTPQFFLSIGQAF
ncbi:MAG: outer membrane protein assembly factor [Paludibacteraceae bacterium]